MNLLHNTSFPSLSGLQSLLHQEVLHAMCEEAPGPVPPSDPGRAVQEEAQLQGRRLVT